MQLELHKSGGAECPECGAPPLISVIRVIGEQHVPLSVDLNLRVGTAPWWRPFKRRWAHDISTQLDQAETQLLELSRWPIAPLPHETGVVLEDRS